MTVLLSVVVPVHGVEGYLYQCLESIRAGLTFEESARVEVIAVDDASPDSCGEMLDGYAARHGDVRVVHLPRNVGLGLARNAGLAEATGEYVWFVDSDDWLPAGSVRAVLTALDEQRPDVLLLDHLRVFENGRTEADPSSALLRGDRDGLLGVQHTAWNKVSRRRYLADNDFRFGPGWYEDVPFSHPVIIAAERLAVLDRVCYLYRVGRLGSITGTRSDRHFEAFEQYDRLSEWVTKHAPTLRPRLFTLMISHLLVVAGNEDRLPGVHRRQFFKRIAALYAKHKPDGHQPINARHKLVALGNYELYAVARAAYRAKGREKKSPTSPAAPVTAEEKAPALR